MITQAVEQMMVCRQDRRETPGDQGEAGAVDQVKDEDGTLESNGGGGAE